MRPSNRCPAVALCRSNLKELAEMATNHVVEEGEAQFLPPDSGRFGTFRFQCWQVVMDSLGQMKKLSKWAIFENQAAAFFTGPSIIPPFRLVFGGHS